MCLDETTVKFEIWDTAGQERYHSLAPMYYRGAQAAIVVFDITKPVLCHWQKHSQDSEHSAFYCVARSKMPRIDVFSLGSHWAKIKYTTKLDMNGLSGQHPGQLFAQ